MKLLLYRNTHDENGVAKTTTPEQEAVWQSQVHAGGFVAHQLDSKHGKTYLKLMDAVLSYEDEFPQDTHTHTFDEILAAVMELVRVGLVRYEIVP
jgi:hypothetical protein